MLFDNILPRVEFLSKLESVLSNLATDLSTKVIFSNLCCHFRSSPGVESTPQKPFSFLIHKKIIRIHSKFYHCSNSVISSGPIFNSSCCFHICSYFLTELLNSSKLSVRAGISSFQSHIIFIFSHKS